MHREEKRACPCCQVPVVRPTRRSSRSKHVTAHSGSQLVRFQPSTARLDSIAAVQHSAALTDAPGDILVRILIPEAGAGQLHASTGPSTRASRTAGAAERPHSAPARFLLRPENPAAPTCDACDVKIDPPASPPPHTSPPPLPSP